MSNIANYTRSLIKAAVSLHAASLKRVELAADKAAERAFKRADGQAAAVKLAETVVRTMREDAARLYREANAADARSLAVSIAVEQELAQLGYRGVEA